MTGSTILNLLVAVAVVALFAAILYLDAVLP